MTTIQRMPTAGVRKAPGHEIAGCRARCGGGSNLSAGYGDLKGTPVAASADKDATG